MDALFNQDLATRREVFVTDLRRDDLWLFNGEDDMNGRLRWFRATNWDGKSWRIDASSHEDSPELRGELGTRGYNGLTLPNERLVLIDSSSRRFVQDYTVLHEMMHVAVDGVDGIDGHAEERIITEMAPRLYPILRQFGLRWPDRPEGFESLERKSRRRSR